MSSSPPFVTLLPVLLQLLISAGLVGTAFWIRRLQRYQEEILANEQQILANEREHRQQHEDLNDQIRAYQPGGRDVP